MNKGKIRVDIDLAAFSEMSSLHTLDDLVEWAIKVRDSVPEEHRAEACLSVDSDYGSGWRFDAYYYRPETEADVLSRKREAKRWAEQRELQERAEYKRLKAKYDKP